MKPVTPLILLVAVMTPGKADSAERPNIVLILVDDLGWSDLGCYGHAWHHTPNIDRLAREGMRFTNGYSPAPICSAARASILTGKAVPRLGFEFVTKHEAGHQQLDSNVPLKPPPFTLNLPLREHTIAERLRELKYHTAFFGKWHVSQHFEHRYLSWHPDFGPKKQGFDIAVEDFGDHPYAWRETEKPADALQGIIPTDSMIKRAADFIRGQHDRPFFLMASSFYVHTPVETRCKWLVETFDKTIPAGATSRDKRLTYAAFLQTLDHHVGVVLDAIEASDLQTSTLVVFMSDNGGHPEFCSNAPLRGSKWNLYEGGIRVPAIARWIGRIQPASTCDTPVIGYDIVPTFVQLAGGEARNVDGLSITELFANPQKSLRRNLVWHFPYYHPESTFSQALDNIGVGDFAVSKTRPQSAIRQGKYKLIRFAEDNHVELFDLSEDIAEQNNLSSQLPNVSREMAALLEQRLDEMNARRATQHGN